MERRNRVRHSGLRRFGRRWWLEVRNALLSLGAGERYRNGGALMKSHTTRIAAVALVLFALLCGLLLLLAHASHWILTHASVWYSDLSADVIGAWLPGCLLLEKLLPLSPQMSVPLSAEQFFYQESKPWRPCSVMGDLMQRLHHADGSRRGGWRVYRVKIVPSTDVLLLAQGFPPDSNYVRVSIEFMKGEKLLSKSSLDMSKATSSGQPMNELMLTATSPPDSDGLVVRLSFCGGFAAKEPLKSEEMQVFLRRWLLASFFELVLLRYRISNEAINRATPSFVANPIVFGGRTESVGLMWETNCNLPHQRVWRSTAFPYADALSPSMTGAGEYLNTPIHSIQVTDVRYVHLMELPTRYGERFALSIELAAHSSSAAVTSTFEVALRPIDSSVYRLALIGDSQYNAIAFRHHLMHINALKPDVLLHVGDVVHDPLKLKEWRTYWTAPLEAAGAVGSKIPVIVARGNHDGETLAAYSFIFGPGNNAWYAFSVGNVRIIVLDSNLSKEPLLSIQTDWLRDELQHPLTFSADFVIAVVHVPPYIEYWDPDVYAENKEWSFVREQWVPILEKGGVQLVISGHSHLYQRSQLKHTVYAIIGGGGAKIDMDKAFDWTVYEVTRFDYHFVTIDLNRLEQTLTWTALDSQGNQIDRVLFFSRKSSRLPEVLGS